MGDTDILRVVIREDFSEDMADQLIHDILSITEDLTKDTASAHLALVSKGDAQQQEGHQADGKHSRHANLRKNPHKPPHGRGVKSKGYAKQC